MNTKLFYSLYEYALSQVMPRCLLREKEEYEACREMSGKALEDLRHMLDRDALDQLERYTDHEGGRESIEGEALFYSGLLIGLELSPPVW